MVLFSSSIAISPLVCGPVAAVPPPAALLPAEPVVIDDPDELAVPALLVPGGGGCETTFPELPAPLGSLPELFRRTDRWRLRPRFRHRFEPANRRGQQGWRLQQPTPSRLSWPSGNLPLNINDLSLIHISEPTRLGMISYAVFCL